MIRPLIFLLGLAASAALLALLADLEGGVQISLGPYEMDLPFLAALIGVLGLCIGLMSFWTLIRWIWQVPEQIKQRLDARKARKGQEALTRGLIAIGTGDLKTAQACAQQAEDLLGDTPLSLLLAAQTAQLSGNRERAEQQFRAMLSVEQTRPLGLRGLFIEASRRGDQEQAHHFAEQAYQLDARTPWSNDALVQWHARRQEWETARQVLKKADISKSDTPAQSENTQRRMAVLLTAHAIQMAPHDKKEALALANGALDLVSDFVPAATLAARLLIKNNDLRKASRLLEKTYAQNPHPDLAELYVHLRHGDSALERLSRAQTLAKLSPDHPDSLYCLAKAELEAHHFDRVRSLLADLLADRPRTRFCLLMARLEALEHGDPSAQRDWLLRAARAPRDAAWIADGLVSDHWQAFSPSSGRLDAFQWQYPQESLHAPALAQEMLDAFAEDPLTRPVEKNVADNKAPQQNVARPPFAKSLLSKEWQTAPSPAEAERPTASPTKPFGPTAKPMAQEVIFPLPTPPDDPGPPLPETEARAHEPRAPQSRFFSQS